MNLFGVHRAPYSELSMLLHQLKCLRDNGSKLASAMNHFYLVILLQSSQAISQLFWSYNTFNRFYLLLRSMWEMCFGGLLLTCKSMVERHLDLCGRYDCNWSRGRIFLWQTKPSPSFCLHRKERIWLRHRGWVYHWNILEKEPMRCSCWSWRKWCHFSESKRPWT